jgi:hypothetical protein
VSWGTALAPSTGWIRGKLVSVSAARLAGPNGFAELGVSGYYPSHTPQTPALVSRELGTSRRALTCPGVAVCLARPSRSLRRAAFTMSRSLLRVCRSVWRAVECPLKTPVGYGLAGSSGRPAGTRSGDSAEEYSGRSRRWHHPWRGASVAPPPIFSPRRRAPCAATGFREHHERTATSGREVVPALVDFQAAVPRLSPAVR